MSASASQAVTSLSPTESIEQRRGSNYKGFIAGVFSGISKLSVGHPFDTIKVRLQTAENGKFQGPLDCLLQTLRNEGVRGVYKGASPPLVGWMFMDSLMLGSLTFYRRLLADQIASRKPLQTIPTAMSDTPELARPRTGELSTLGHACAGVLAGWTVSFIAAPIEHVKARLQIQYAASKSRRLYSGPIDCTKKLVSPQALYTAR